MNVLKLFKESLCKHEWCKEVVETTYLDIGGCKFTTGCPRWTCKKCGKISWVNPHT